ncbi:MAG: hypothetical protein A2042_02845 [Candidatus Schekmanbacteria bacterium GWA2_38_11]|uniref:PilZ domain-containing protein n=1 Tax=Candidatus Schekmanbacteria bacterium GWA2_38_11 TaxID=1817876 RepID=A0A1F7RF08_9BACT|nr:MAG: hypothetical protein A2042_02845 [Candidatus Schekmanbacteria bacterium GWA2_38_11]
MSSSSEEKEQHIPDIIELNLKSETIDHLFTEVGTLILKSPKILNTSAALREFQNLQKFWSKKGNELIEKEEEFFSKSVFPLCVNYCSFLDISEPLMFLGRSIKGIDLHVKKSPPSKTICMVLFHSIESYEHLTKDDKKRQKINIYWNNFLKNQIFLDRFMDLKDVKDYPKMIEEITRFDEKRKEPRFNVFAPAHCSMLGESWVKDQKEKAKILNISLSGLLIEHLSPYYINSILEIEPFLDNNNLYLWGKICRTDSREDPEGEKFTSGIKITNISEFDKIYLAKYLSTLNPLC